MSLILGYSEANARLLTHLQEKESFIDAHYRVVGYSEQSKAYRVWWI